MLTIRRSDVPLYLRDGSLFDSLDAQDDDTFQVPSECLKDDASVASEVELVHLLQTVRFWGLFVMPVQICEYILENGQTENYERLPDLFPELATYLECVLRAKELSTNDHDRIAAVIEAGLGVSIVRMLHDKGYGWNETACECAARMNDVESLMYLHTEGCPWDVHILQTAAESNSVLCLQYAVDFGGFDADGMYEATNTAASLGNVECMRILRAAGASWDDLTVSTAITGDHVEAVCYLHTQGCEISLSVCCLTAMSTGNVEMLRYLHEVAGQSLFGVIAASAQSGHLDCLRYAHEHGMAWHADVCMVAARGGHLHCLRYAREHGCPWNEETVKAAVSAQSWECLTYALWHGCPWYSHTFILIWFCLLVFVFSVQTFPNINAVIFAVAGMIVVTLSVYRKHVGKYFSVRNVDRTTQSSFLLMLLYKICTEFHTFQWVFQVVSVPAFLLLAAVLVRVNMIHIPMSLNE